MAMNGYCWTGKNACPTWSYFAAVLKRQDEMEEGAKRDTRGAFGKPGLGVVVPSGTGDIQVDPWGVACKFADEPSTCDGASTFATANILNVSKTSLDEFAILVVHRKLPHFFADGFGAGEQFVRPGLVGAEDADVDIGERDNDGAG